MTVVGILADHGILGLGKIVSGAKFDHGLDQEEGSSGPNGPKSLQNPHCLIFLSSIIPVYLLLALLHASKVAP